MECWDDAIGLETLQTYLHKSDVIPAKGGCTQCWPRGDDFVVLFLIQILYL